MSIDRTFILREETHARSLYAFLKANWEPMANRGKPLSVHVSEAKAKRSIDQNKRYWALLNEIASQAWLRGHQYSVDVWAEYYKRKFIGCEELPDGSQVGISTTTLSVGEFADYMTKIEAHAASELAVAFEFA